jgi:hypothetical protein
MSHLLNYLRHLKSMPVYATTIQYNTELIKPMIASNYCAPLKIMSLILDDGAVVGVGCPVRRDDLVGHQRLAGLVGDAQREWRGEPVAGVQPPDGPPGLAHRRPRLGVSLHEVHLHDVAVAVLILDEHRHIHGVGALLDVERHLLARVVAGDSACDMFPLAFRTPGSISYSLSPTKYVVLSKIIKTKERIK